jgi:hypothetical protein
VVYPGFRIPWKQEVAWDKTALERCLAPVRAFQQRHHVPIFAGDFGCARFAPGAEQWLRDQMDLYETYGWSWAYSAFREWDVMNIERTADPADKMNRADTPLLRLFRSYFAKDKQFFKAERDPAEAGFVPYAHENDIEDPLANGAVAVRAKPDGCSEQNRNSIGGPWRAETGVVCWERFSGG